MRTPDDALVQVGDADAIVLVVVKEEKLILGFRHVVDGARIGRIEDLLVGETVVGVDLDPEIALRDLHACGAVAVDPHGSEVDEVDVHPRVDDGAENVVRGREVVAHGIALVGGRLHRVRRRPLFGEVDDGVRPLLHDERQQAMIVFADREVDVPDRLARHLGPGAQALAERADRGEALHFEFHVDLAARQVVDDDHLVPALGEVEAGGPAAESIAAEHDDLSHGVRSGRVGRSRRRSGPTQWPAGGETEPLHAKLPSFQGARGAAALPRAKAGDSSVQTNSAPLAPPMIIGP